MSTRVHTSGFRLELRCRVNEIGFNDVIRRMGYSKATTAVRARLDNVLSDQLLGLDDSSYDFRYTSTQFVAALCRSVSFSQQAINKEVQRIESVVRAREQAFKPFLFVDTGFVRGGQPIAVLALAESRRRIFFDRAFRDLGLNAQIGLARIRARDHYRENEGHLPIWGLIRQYEFHYSDGQMYLIECDGSLIKATLERFHSHAMDQIVGALPGV